MIKLDKVSRWFGAKRAVNEISFHLKAGEILGFVGPNGAGKSTTMRMITGYLPLSLGSIHIGGYDISVNPLKAKSLMGYLPENAPLYPGISVESFLFHMGRLRGMSTKQLEVRLPATAAACCIQHVLSQGVDTLSKGYQHRVCLAQALIHDPQILILDEPTDGLDPNQKREVRNLVRLLGREGKTIILSTHILEEVDAVCSRVMVINGGQKVFDGSVSEFRHIAGNEARIEIEIEVSSVIDFQSVIMQIPEIKQCIIDTESAGRIRARLVIQKGCLIEQVKELIKSRFLTQGWEKFSIGDSEIKLEESFWEVTQTIPSNVLN